MSHKKKKKKSYVFLIIVLVLCAIGIGYCGFKLYNIYQDYHQSDVEYEQLAEKYVKPTKSDDKPADPDNPEPTDEYDLLEIDWESLQKINSDIIGWIRIPDTPINYPIVQGETNDTYIHKTFEKRALSSGALFLDARNSKYLDDYASIIYGHNMKNGSMFGYLGKYLNEDFYNAHRRVEIYTPEWTKIYEVNFVYLSKYTDTAYDLTAVDKESYARWIDDRQRQSIYKDTQIVSLDNKSIVLSTCHGRAGGDERCIIVIQEVAKY